jgi:hypothetical protein
MAETILNDFVKSNYHNYKDNLKVNWGLIRIMSYEIMCTSISLPYS